MSAIAYVEDGHTPVSMALPPLADVAPAVPVIVTVLPSWNVIVAFWAPL